MSHADLSITPAGFLKLLGHELRWALISALARSDYRVQELVQLLQQPMNLVSYHLKQLRDHQLVSERRSSADGRDIYYSLDLDLLRTQYRATGAALHPSLAGAEQREVEARLPTVQPVARVLFLCTHNSARSQMAEALLRHLSDGRVVAYSAGSTPAQVHPLAVQTMASMGIDIRQQYSKSLDQFARQSFDYIITVCDHVREVCPRFPDDPESIHWSFADPSAEQDQQAQQRAFAQTAQQLARRIRHLLTRIDHGGAHGADRHLW